jgi:chromosome partitioning protein
MAKVFAIANQKGGVGKTTTCVNLAASLVATKRRVLLIDLDPQGNATMGSGVDKLALEHSVYDVLTGECDLAIAMQFSEHGGYQLLPANRDLTAAEVALLDMPSKEHRLREALAPIRENYDYILIDCPPSLSMLTINALVASDGVIIPMQCEYYALEGLSDLVNSIQRIGQLLNPSLRIEGLLRTKSRPSSRRTSATSSTTPSSRVTCAWPKPPAMACPPWSTTSNPVAPSPIWRWQANWSAASARTPKPLPHKESAWPRRNEVWAVAWTPCWPAVPSPRLKKKPSRSTPANCSTCPWT